MPAQSLADRLDRLCGCADGSTPADRRNLRRLNVLSILWVTVTLASLWMMERYGDASLGVSAVALAAAGLSWLSVVWAYLSFLREADELTRSIQMRAMAVAFCAGLGMALLGRFIERVVGFLPPSPLPIEALDLLNPAMAMLAGFVIAVATLRRRYSR